ncbi:MAG: MFS transporter, partial [Pseudomonadales bacterium]
LTALAGTSIEWYDFFLYATAAALIFPTLFFSPDMPPAIGLIASFSTFAVGFLARPIGGVLFGHYGDRYGRKKALVVAMLLMGGATTLIGLLPGYATLGVAAPLLLMLLRFAQGLAIGGQWGGAMLLVTENAPVKRRGFYGAYAQAGAAVGMIMANLAFLGVTYWLAPDEFMEWGWRLPFLFSIVLIGLSLYVQYTMEETPEFHRLQAASAARAADSDIVAQTSPVLQAARKYPREILLAAGAFLAVQVTFYILVAFLLAYGTNEAGLALPRSVLLIAVLIGSVVQIPALFIASAYSDRHGRRGVYMLGAALMAVYGFVLFPLVDTGSPVLIVLAMALGQILIGMMYGPQAAFLAEMFSAEVRYSGVSLGYQIGAILGGALAPIVATALLARYQSTIGVSIYIALACLITLVSVYLLKETGGENTKAL